MVDFKSHCPECGSVNLLEVVYGFPTPDELSRVEYGTAVLAGPHVYDAMPTRRCANCGCWWHPTKSQVDYNPSNCHFCGMALTTDDQLSFAAAINAYWVRIRTKSEADKHALFSLHPLPSCLKCCRSIQASIDERLAEDEHQQTQRRRCLPFIITASLIWAAAMLISTISDWLRSP